MTKPDRGLFCTTGTTPHSTTGTACHTLPALCTFQGGANRHVQEDTLTQLYLTLTTLLLGTQDRLKNRLDDRDDSGLATLEIVVIALGLFLIAAIAVAVLTGAINTRLNQIK